MNLTKLNTSLLCSIIIFAVYGCTGDLPSKKTESHVNKVKPVIPPKIKFGFNFNNYSVVTKKIKRGDTFGQILEENGIDYPEVHNILQKIKTQVNVRKLKRGAPYTILFSKDSLPIAKTFIYHPDIESYTVINLKDSIYGKKMLKPVKIVKQEAAGNIENSLYESMIDNGLNEELTYLLSDIYAWTIDFFRLQKGDSFKIIYTEKFVDDTISIGIDKVDAALFTHSGKDYYAFAFKRDSLNGIIDYFDTKAKNLRRAFLKAPVKFSRVSSRYNLRRRISYYGNKIRPHRGTDFAASVGTPILATADGVVTKSRYSKANGNYVTIKHNNTYTTQYLHMKKRMVKKGTKVRQGEVIGLVGMTGYTSGPHVCYRFWKNGRQVDPFRQKLPEAKPISENLKNKYLAEIVPLKFQLDCISKTNMHRDEYTDLAILTSNID